MGDCFRHNKYVYILYLRHEDSILTIVFMDLPITTTLAGESLNRLIFRDDIKSITANGYMIIYVGTNYIFHMMIIYFMQKNYGKH